MSLSLRQRTFWWSLGTTLFIIAAVFVVVDGAFRTTIRSDLDRRLASALRLAAEVQASEVQRALGRTVDLTSEPTLRAAVGTGDAATIRERLQVLIDGSAFAWLAVSGTDGALLTGTAAAPLDLVQSASALRDEARFYETADLWQVDGRLVEVLASAVFIDDTPRAVVLAGHVLGPDRVRTLEALTGQRIAFLAHGEDAAEPGGDEMGGLGVEGLREGPAVVGLFDARANPGDIAPDPMSLELEGDEHVAAGLSLPDASGSSVGTLALFESLDEAMAPARRLRRDLLVLALAGILLALWLSDHLSRRVTDPVSRLLDETVRLGSGDLSHPVVPERRDEIGALAEGFEQMRVSLLSARQDLIQAERLSAVGQAASAIVHDFSQPLTAIVGHAQLLGDGGTPEEQADDLAMIRQQADRLQSMMSEILAFTRGGDRLHQTRGPVPDLLRQVAATSRTALAERDISLAIDSGYDGDWLLDFAKTVRILENLVRNAAGAIGSDGMIRIRSRRVDGALRLEVEDDGPGIPKELRTTLFEPFVTHGKADGTGLGLAIVKRYVQAQGGTIRVDTSEQGTTFTLDFPREGADDDGSADHSTPDLDPRRRQPGGRAAAGIGSGGPAGA